MQNKLAIESGLPPVTDLKGPEQLRFPGGKLGQGLAEDLNILGCSPGVAP